MDINSLEGFNWELTWAPYDEATYQAALELITPQDVVVDIGAGDLRLARKMALLCQRVYAIEINRALIQRAQQSAGPLPANLILWQGDARRFIYPKDVTVGVLLMRHCTHFHTFANQLKSAGAHSLITNARWGMGIECLPLQSERIPYQNFEIGWYGCICGGAGFKAGPAGKLTEAILAFNHEVVQCPNCTVKPNRFLDHSSVLQG